MLPLLLACQQPPSPAYVLLVPDEADTATDPSHDEAWDDLVHYAQSEVDHDGILGISFAVILDRAFQKRHLLAHRMGVIDDDYLRKTGDPHAVAGRRVTVEAAEVEAAATSIRRWAEALLAHLAAPSRSDHSSNSGDRP